MIILVSTLKVVRVIDIVMMILRDGHSFGFPDLGSLLSCLLYSCCGTICKVHKVARYEKKRPRRMTHLEGMKSSFRKNAKKKV